MRHEEIISKYKELVYLTGPDYKDPDIPGSNYAYRDDQKKARIEQLRKELSLLQEQEKEPVPILTDLTEDDRRNTIDQFVRMTAYHTLHLFIMLGLKTHIEARIVNEPTKEEFVFSFKKVTNTIPLDQSGIREELIKFVAWAIKDYGKPTGIDLVIGKELIDDYLKSNQ